ncbi:MAG: TolC family protein [Deltaproteobacteria bacterium]|nr:TolC family protein [Deltaproteobacteria bacterium]
MLRNFDRPALLPVLTITLVLAAWPAPGAGTEPVAAAGPEGEAGESPAVDAAAGEESPPPVATLPLPSLLQRAVDSSPMVSAANAQIDAARTVGDQVSAYPVPTVGIQAMDFPGDPMNGYGEIWYTASQMFPLGDARDRRAEAAQAGADEAVADRATLQLDLVLQIRLAWVELARSLADVLVVVDQADTMRRMSRIANNAYAAGVGMGSQADTLRARAEIPMLEDEQRMSEAMATSARAMISAMAALVSPEAPADPPVIDVDGYEAPALPALEELLAEALEHRPEFAALEARASAAESMGQAAAEERLPDLMLEGGVQQRIGGNMPPVAFMLGVSITLPWASSDQYDAMEAQARAMGRMVRADGDGLRFAIESDLRQQIARYEQLAGGLELTRKTIRNLRQAENAAVAAYTAGNGDFDSILNLESRLVETRRSLVRNVHEIQAVRARIDRIIALPIEEQIEQAEGWS